jgi:hypothetical protein
MRMLIASEPERLFLECYCAPPMAPTLPLSGTKTSARRRFFGQLSASRYSPTVSYVGCRVKRNGSSKN